MVNGDIAGDRALVGASAPTTFFVGEIVEVTRDKGHGRNRDGGPAWVVEVRGSGGEERYDVKYVLDNRLVKDLDVTALSRSERTPKSRRTNTVSDGSGGGGAAAAGGNCCGRGGGESELERTKRELDDMRRRCDQQAQDHKQDLYEQAQRHEQEMANERAAARQLRQRLDAMRKDMASQATAHRQLQAKRNQLTAEHNAVQAQVRGWLVGLVVTVG